MVSLSRSKVRKTLGSVAVVATAAAVAGLGTWGTWGDSTTPVDTGVQSGVLSIALAPATVATVPHLHGGMLPGDSYTRPLNLVNDGGTPLSSVTASLVATASSVLDSDTAHGLQLEVWSCSQPWDVVGAGYSCGGVERLSYDGPAVVADHVLAGSPALLPGGIDHLLATLSLPDSAGNSFQDAESALSLVFTATQRAGAPR
jgi:hypothetical protein